MPVLINRQTRFIGFGFFTALIIAALIIGCSGVKSDGSPSGPTGSGTIRVITKTSGSGTDPDGYSVTVLQVTKPIAVNDTVLFEDVSAGTYSVSLDGFGSLCIAGSNPRRGVVVTANQTTTVTFTVTCTAVDTGTIEVKIYTEGTDPDSRYYIVLNDSDSTDVNVSPPLPDTTVVRLNVSTGVYKVELVDIAGNCSVISSNPLTGIVVNENEVTYVQFTVGCVGASVPNGIVFVRRDLGSVSQVWICDTLGQNQTQLTFHSNDCWGPFFSPDGSKILYALDSLDDQQTPHGKIMIMDADGTNANYLSSLRTMHNLETAGATWTPDGSGLVIYGHNISPEGPWNYFLYNLAANSLGPPLLDNTQFSPWVNPGPAFQSSADNRVIFHALNGSFSPYYAIYSVDPVGTIDTVARDESGWGFLDPRWSPSGGKVVFIGPGAPRSVWVVDADGNNAHEVYAPLSHDAFGATWLDDSRIGFQQINKPGLYIINDDGTGLTGIDTLGTADNFNHPHWNPNP